MFRACREEGLMVQPQMVRLLDDGSTSAFTDEEMCKVQSWQPFFSQRATNIIRP